jgi:TRAP-type transport system small permease protein
VGIALIARLDRAVAFIAAALLVALLVVVSLGVVTRALEDPLIWTDEASRFLMIWIACLGWTLAGRKRAHIRIRFFVDLLPAAMRRGTEVFMQCAVTLFGAMVAWYGLDLVVRNVALEATTLPVTMSVMYLPVALVGIATALQAGSELAEILRGVPPADTPVEIE